MKILHAFADCGTEGEALSAFGDVHRYSIDPEPNPCNAEVVEMDLMEESPDETFAFGMLHPPCVKWCDMPGVDPDDHENMIPRAREIAEETCDYWVIENKPRAPLNDPTVLSGKTFGLPIEYKRAFEANFHIPQPPRQQTLGTETSPFYYSERSPEWWKAIKGVRHDYPKQHLAKNTLPMCYVFYLCRAWLDASGRSEGESDYSEYNEENERKRREKENASLFGSDG